MIETLFSTLTLSKIFKQTSLWQKLQLIFLFLYHTDVLTYVLDI